MKLGNCACIVPVAASFYFLFATLVVFTNFITFFFSISKHLIICWSHNVCIQEGFKLFMGKCFVVYYSYSAFIMVYISVESNYKSLLCQNILNVFCFHY